MSCHTDSLQGVRQINGCESRMATIRSGQDQTGTGKGELESRFLMMEKTATQLSDSTRKTKHSLEGRSQETGQSKHELNGEGTDGVVSEKLPKDWRMTGFCRPYVANCACSIVVIR